MSLEYYKSKMVSLRAKLEKEKEAKKKDNEHYADLVKRSSTPSSKESYRKSKISHAASHDRNIESIKQQIERCKKDIEYERKKKK